VIATTDPVTLPDISTWYLVTNLPAPGSLAAEQSQLAAASIEEVIRLYGLRMWIEQSYKQVRGALGWSEYQVRSDRAIRRHWQLVCCAFSFCWYHHSHCSTDDAWLPEPSGCQITEQEEQVPQQTWGAGKKNERTDARSTAAFLAKSTARGQSEGPNPGSCCSAIGGHGPHSPYLFRFSNYLMRWLWGYRSSFITLPNPRQQSTDT